MNNNTTNPAITDAALAEQIRERAKRLGLYSLATMDQQALLSPWIQPLIESEEIERHNRSLNRRLRAAKIQSFKHISDYDWKWPTRIDRQQVEELFSLQFRKDGANVVFMGTNGLGKTMLAQNLAHHALLQGVSVVTTTASDMLNSLASQDGAQALSRRIRHYCNPQLLFIDEVGYLSYDNRHADLLFEVVSRRYRDNKPILLTTNREFQSWTEIFPNAACVVTLVDRLIHRSEIVIIEGESYRLEEARRRNAAKPRHRRSAK